MTTEQPATLPLTRERREKIERRRRFLAYQAKIICEKCDQNYE